MTFRVLQSSALFQPWLDRTVGTKVVCGAYCCRHCSPSVALGGAGCSVASAPVQHPHAVDSWLAAAGLVGVDEDSCWWAMRSKLQLRPIVASNDVQYCCFVVVVALPGRLSLPPEMMSGARHGSHVILWTRQDVWQGGPCPWNLQTEVQE